MRFRGRGRAVAIAWLIVVAMVSPRRGQADELRPGDAAKETPLLSLGGARFVLAHRVRTASMPWSVTPSPDGRSLYVAHVGVGKRHRDNVWRYDAESLEVKAKSAFPGHAVEIAVTRDGRRIFTTDSRVHELLELDPRDLSVRARWTPGEVPKDLRLTADESRAVVANWGSHDLALVDLETPGAPPRRVRTGRHTRGVELAADGATAYAMAFSANHIAVVSLNEMTVTERLRPGCDRPRHAVATERFLLVTCNGNGLVVVIDLRTRQVARRLPVGPGPKTIALSPDRRLAVVANERGNSITAIEIPTWKTTTARVPGKKPCGASFSPDGRRLYLTLRGSHELLVLVRQDPHE